MRATGPEQKPNADLEALAEALLEPVARRARQGALNVSLLSSGGSRCRARAIVAVTPFGGSGARHPGDVA